MKKLLLIDGSSLLHRAFYALPLLHNALGEYTNGVYGFMTMLNRMLTEQQPDYVIICFDEGRITFRNEIFADYKGTRQETPRELRNQFEILKEVLDAGGIFHIEKAGYEADDLIGTFSRQAEEDGCKTLLFSGDKDVFQLIDDYTDVFMTRRGITNIDVWNVKTVQDVYGLTPAQLIDFKALMGDSSDNIPGVPGVGEKTALKLMQQFGSVANLYQNLDQVKGEKLRQKLADNQELVTICQKLAKIDRRVPVEIEWDKYRFSGLNGEALRPVYQRLEFNRLLKDLKDTAKPVNDSADKAPQFISEMLENTEDLNKLVVDAQNAGQCACYFTWKGQAIKGEITDFGLAIDGKSYAIDFLWQREAKLASLAPIFSDSAIDKVVANSKELSEILAAYNYDLSENTQDVILAAYVLDPSVSEYKVRDLAAENNLFLAPCDDPVMETACMASVLESLHDLQEEQLREKKMWELYEKIELPTARVLAQMERAGITVEGEQLRLMSDVLAKKAARIEKEIYRLAGENFNLNSPRQLSVILFEKMGLPPMKKTKTGYSTNAEVLEQLSENYPIAAQVQEYRMYSKLKSTYTDGLWPLIDPLDGKIHTTFKQTVTATGRLSSVAPNLQNIPIRMEIGKKIRQVFTATKPDNILLSADYNQIELRILAHISQDKTLMEAFREGQDIHARTAAEVFDVPMEQVTKEMRRQAKAVNFGIVYGISDYGLSRDLKISRQQAKEYIEKYFSRYPLVEAYQKEIIISGEKQGYVSTILGRRRYLPELNNRNFNLRSFAQRMAINTPIQGSAADVIKVAMVDLAAKLRQQGLKSQMILQVHDELIFDVFPEEKQLLSGLVKEAMEQAVQLSVPLKVDLKCGHDWYNMEKL